jgi:hypothetical protein
MWETKNWIIKQEEGTAQGGSVVLKRNLIKNKKDILKYRVDSADSEHGPMSVCN